MLTVGFEPTAVFPKNAHIGIRTHSFFFQKMLTVGFEPIAFFHLLLTVGCEPTAFFPKKILRMGFEPTTKPKLKFKEVLIFKCILCI